MSETLTVGFWRARIEEARQQRGIDNPVRAAVGYTTGKEAEKIEQLSRAILEKHLPPYARVLEIGCGWGYLVPMLPAGVKYLGIDLVPEFIVEAIKSFGDRPDTSFLLGDLTHPKTLAQFASDSFNVVVGRWVDATVGSAMGSEMWTETLRQLCRIGGRVVLFSPGHTEPRIYQELRGAPVMLQDYQPCS